MGYGSNHVRHKENLDSESLKWFIALFSNLLRLIIGDEKHILQGVLQFAGVYNNTLHKETPQLVNKKDEENSIEITAEN